MINNFWIYLSCIDASIASKENRFFQNIDITEAWSQMTSVAVSLALFHFCANKYTYAHTGTTYTPILLMMICGGLCPHYVSTYWHYITLNMTYHTLSVNPNVRWAEKGRLHYLWNKAVGEKPVGESISIGAVSIYVNALRHLSGEAKWNQSVPWTGRSTLVLWTSVLTVRQTENFSLFLVTLFYLMARHVSSWGFNICSKLGLKSKWCGCTNIPHVERCFFCTCTCFICQSELHTERLLCLHSLAKILHPFSAAPPLTEPLLEQALPLSSLWSQAHRAKLLAPLYIEGGICSIFPQEHFLNWAPCPPSIV